MARSCGIRIGPRRYELVVLDGNTRKHRVAAFQAGEFPQGGEDPVADAARTLKEAARNAGVPGDSLGIAIDTGLAAFRTVKLPDLDESKLEQVIKFEVESELPQWSIDDVIVDFMKLESASGETSLLVTAVPKADLAREIEVCSRAGIEPLEVELEATAMVNAALLAEVCSVDEAQVLVHIGETSTAVVVMDGGKVRSMRGIHIGALSHEPGKAGGPESPPATVAPEELRRLQEQAVSRIRRELGRTVSGARTANPIEAVYVCGWELPDLVGTQVVDVPVYELDVFEKDSGQPAEGAAPLVVAYGVALRQLGSVPLQSRLRREELRYTGAFERVELPLAIGALLLFTMLALFNIFEAKQGMLRESDVNLWRQSANNYMLGNMRASPPARGSLDPVPDELQRYIDRIRREGGEAEVDPQRSRREQLDHVLNTLKREVGKLDDELGNTGEITQPQSALEGMALVLATLSELGEEVGRVAVRKIDSQTQRSGSNDSVEVKLDLTFFGDSDVEATAHSELFANALQEKDWVIAVEPRGSDVFSEGDVTGITVEAFTVRCDLSKLRAQEDQP